MKKLVFICLSVILTVQAIADEKKNANDPAGRWKFEAPYAPEGFTTGFFEVKFNEEKYSAILSFEGSEYLFPCEKVKFENNTLTFNLYLEEMDIALTLKFDEPDKMSGRAVYAEGEIPLSLVREKKK